MKPVYLSFCGVNSFSEPAEIDFRSLLEYGLFGIFGDTGSGKSTILDCINFALYGEVPRLSSRNLLDLINDRSDRATVVFEYEIFYEGKRRRFRVERELRRKGLHSAKVYEREGEELKTLSDGVRETRALSESIVGLEQKDFEKCIALPQGEFAQFVKTASSDRLKLMARLFDLEEYGERLVKKSNARYARLRAEGEVAKARLEPYLEITAEANAALGEEIAALEEKERAAKAALGSAREEERRTAELFRRAAERERTERALSALRAREGEIALLERELGRLGAAQTAVAAERERREAAEHREAAERAIAERERDLMEAEKLKEQCAAFDGEGADEELAELASLHAAAERREELKKRAQELAQRLERTRREYAGIAERLKGFSYEAESEALNERLSALGEGDFLSFAEEHGKRELLRNEYAAFSGELKELYREYPETEEGIVPLIRKYTALSEGEKGDFARVKAAFDERERMRRELERARLDLEKRNGAVRADRERLALLQTEGLRVKEELSALEGQTAEGEPLEEIEKRQNAIKRAKRENAELRDRADGAARTAAAALAAARATRESEAEAEQRAKKRLREALSQGAFASAEEAEALSRRFGDPEKGAAEAKKFREEYAALSARARELEGDYSGAREEDVRAAAERTASCDGELRTVVGALAVKRGELARGQEALSKKKELERERDALAKRTELAERLKKLFEGNKFMEFVAEEYLQSVTENGSRRLLSLTSGRYFLRYEGGFLVGDNLAGGKLRGVHTLSGGETFLVSLSLALALSAEICSKSLRPIEFFFLDEGFGTLDERLVDTVMDSLETLKGEHFSIGVISHVEELKHRIEKKLYVEKATDTHGSRIHA